MKGVIVAVALILLAAPAQAQADERYCWTDTSPDEYGVLQVVTRCRVAGEIVDYASEGSVPGWLYPAVGTAANGTCWYWRSVWTGWVFIIRNSDGTATFGYDSDGEPGGPLNVDVTYPVCTSEPTTGEPDILTAWDLASEYVHVEPDPILNPQIPWGLTGAETHLRVDPPPPFSEQIVDPLGQTLEVTGRVVAVTIAWGDGGSSTFAETEFPLLTGYPNGLARHIYEVKTCDPPGSTPRCHSSLASYPLTVAFRWEVQWRDGASPWAALAVPDTSTTVAYPVNEIIAVLESSS